MVAVGSSSAFQCSLPEFEFPESFSSSSKVGLVKNAVPFHRRACLTAPIKASKEPRTSLYVNGESDSVSRGIRLSGFETDSESINNCASGSAGMGLFFADSIV